MAFAPSAEGLLALASALPLIVLGASLLRLRPRRPENLFFAAFAIGWGLQVAAANAGRLTQDPGLHEFFFLANIVLTLPTAYVLAHFASIHPRRNVVARHALGPFLLLAAFLPGLIVLLVKPSLLIASTTDVAGRPLSVYGPWAIPLIAAPFFGAFYYALLVQMRAAQTDALDVGAQRARMVALALAPFVAYVSTRQFLNWTFPYPPFDRQPSTVQLQNVLLFGTGLALILTLTLFLLARSLRRHDADRALLTAFLLPILVAGAERMLRTSGIQFESLALWRIATVALVVYAISRYQLFDLDLRLRRAFAATLAPALALATVALVASLRLGGVSGWAVAGAIVAGAALNVAAWQSRHRLASLLLPASSSDASYLHHRKLEVYRVELERRLATDPALSHAQPDLRRLRAELGLSEHEHHVLEYVARGALGRSAATPGAPQRLEPGARVNDRYRVDRLLGEGAHGRAYLAYDERDERPVVIKAVPNTLLGGRAARLLLREARIVSKIHHPNVVELFDAFETSHESLLVMEYCDGGSLYGLLHRRGRLDPVESARLMDGVLGGLEAAHAHGIVHRDLKPENILLKADGAVKLADFGVARETQSDRTVGATELGAAGTLLYMSPEQVRGVGVDARSDLYAAGVVYHQLVTGRFYLRVAGLDDFQVRQRILQEPPRLEVADAAVTAFLAKALEKDPQRRFQTAAEMRASFHSATRAPKAASHAVARPVPTSLPP